MSVSHLPSMERKEVSNTPNDPVPYRLAEGRVKSKLAKYGHVPAGYEVLPFVLETSGGFHLTEK
jgi:hypothetical protein